MDAKSHGLETQDLITSPKKVFSTFVIRKMRKQANGMKNGSML